MENIWPAIDGNSWTFEVAESVFDEGWPLFDTMEDLPDLPSLEELYEELQQPCSGSVFDSGSAILSIAFHNPVENGSLTVFDVDFDLAGIDDTYAYPPFPLLLGITWVQGDEEIYCMDEMGLDWQYAQETLQPGHEFTVAIGTNVDSEITLTTRIWSIGDFTVGDRQYDNCLECFYLMNVGLVHGTDENGNPTGIARIFSYGVIIYAPGTGPVLAHEKWLGGPDVVVEKTAVLTTNTKK